MRVLQIHVYYTRSSTSGENSTVESISGYLADLSESQTIFLKVAPHGSSFKSLFLHNSKLVQVLFEIVMSYHKYDVVFFHNQVPFVPAILLRFLSKRMVVVKVWHNVRPFCIGGSAFLQGKVCWKCSNQRKGKLNAIINNCYRSSRLQTLLALFSQWGLLATIKSDDVYNVTVSQFLRDTLISRGFKENRVFAIENTVSMPRLITSDGEDFVFIGRVTVEKGIVQLLQAWKVYKHTYPGHQSLHIIGDGPLLDQLKDDYGDSRTIFHGFLKHDRIVELAKICGFGIIPNVWEEPFGKVALDHICLGLRILATKSGGILEILENDPGVRFIGSLEPENLAKEMFDFSRGLVPLDLSLRSKSLELYEAKAIELKWRDLLDFIASKHAI
jgi:glycosyltransferase involved in cell wall biosynthesis